MNSVNVALLVDTILKLDSSFKVEISPEAEITNSNIAFFCKIGTPTNSIEEILQELNNIDIQIQVPQQFKQNSSLYLVVHN